MPYNNTDRVTHLTGPLFVLWGLTRHCDLACPYCYAKDEGDEELSDREAEAVAAELVQLRPRHVYFSGGEPLKREALLRSLAQRLGKSGIRCGLITDGTLVTGKNARWIEKHFFEVQVGLDGAEPAVHDRVRGREGAFAQAERALELLGGRGVQLGIVMALHKATADQVIRVAGFATKVGASALYLPWLARAGRARNCPELFLSTAERLEVIEQQITEAKLQFGSRLKVQVSDPYAFARRMVTRKVPNATLYIQSDGMLAPLQLLPWADGDVRDGIRKNWEQHLATFWTSPKVVRAIEEAISLDDLWAQTSSSVSDEAENGGLA